MATRDDWLVDTGNPFEGNIDLGMDIAGPEEVGNRRIDIRAFLHGSGTGRPDFRL